MRATGIISGLIILLAGLPATGETETFEQRHRERADALRHPALSLGIRLPKRSFFQGEAIPVTFRFEDATDSKDYQVWTGSYDRSGRISSVAFHVEGEPGDFADPLATWFLGGFFGMGGLGNDHELGVHEQDFLLNEWIRFDRPGTYRFFATADRVSHRKEVPRAQVELVSPIVEIEIREATAAELESTFSEANAAWKPGIRAAGETGPSPIDRLRYLDSEASRNRLRELLGEGSGAEGAAMFGLIGSRQVDEAIRLLEEGITDPEVAVTANYLNALSRLRLQKEPPKPVEVDASGEGGGLVAFGWGPVMDHYGDREDWLRLVDAFDDKVGRARAVSAYSLLGLVRNERQQEQWAIDHGGAADSKRPKLPDRDAVVSKIRVPLAAVFGELRESEQEDLLENAWDLARCPEFAEPLRSLVDRPMERSESAHYSGLRSWAMLRYAELEPETGQSLILEDLLRPKPLYSLEVLGSLPDELVKPELPRLIDNLESERRDIEKIAGLLDRYGDASVANAVERRYLESEGKWACAIQTHFLRYLIRVDRPRGLDLTFRAMDLREDTGCYRSVVPNVLSDFYSPEVEAKILEFFRAEREPDVIVNIARVFRNQGSETVIDGFLDQLERLDPEVIEGDLSYDSEAGAHRELRQILLRKADAAETDWGTPWKFTEEQRDRLRECLVTEQDRSLFQTYLENGRDPGASR